MDVIKFNFGSKLMRRLISKFLMKYIKKHFDCNTQIELEELKFAYADGDMVLKTDVKIRMNKHDVKKILEKLDEDEF